MSDADSQVPPIPPYTQDASGAGQEQANQSKSDPEQRINGLQSLLGRKETERRQALDERDTAQAELSRLKAEMDAAFQPGRLQDDDESEEEGGDVAATASQSTMADGTPRSGHIDPNNPARSANTPVTDDNDLAALKRDLNNAFNAAIGRGPG